MKKRNLITVLALTMAIGLGATAYAASADTDTSTAPQQRLGLGRITGMKGYDYVFSVLNKLGSSDEDINNALSSGKTMYDLATDKGITQDDFKDVLLEERTKAIDAAVAKGTITEEEGEEIKENLKNNMTNCTGHMGLRQGQRRGQGFGRMGNGQGGANCIFAGSN